MEPRAITGLGIVSTVGIGREAFFRAMNAPRSLSESPHRKLESFDASKYQSERAYEALGFDPAKLLGDKGLRTLDRITKLLIVGARLALHDAGIKKDNAFVAPFTPERTGVLTSNAYGSLEAITELDRVAILEDARYINPAKFPNTVANSASGYVSIWEELRALNVAVCDGNCGALDAVTIADVHFSAGRADALLVGGGEAMSEPLFVAFMKLGALDLGARLGEGAAYVVMEPKAAAKKRGASTLGEAIGFGTSFVGPDTEAPLLFASPVAMKCAIEAALADANVAAKDIDVVASGISGLKAFDEHELRAIREVLGEDICVAAPKDLLGETLGAAGAMGMAAALAWFQGAPVTPVVSGNWARAEKPKTVLVTTLGYYGNASAVVLRAS